MGSGGGGGGAGGEEAAEGGGERRQRAAESLGWLTESSVMPKKHKAIEGVGPSSMVELRAQYYRTQQEARHARAGDSETDALRAKKKPLRLDFFSDKNTGVEARNTKDKLELKAINDGSNSYAALEKKAQLYDKLKRGELSDEEEKYSVDFFSKRQLQDELESNDAANNVEQKNVDDGSEDAFSKTSVAPAHVSTSFDPEEHKRFVREVHEEANQARERATTLKMRRQEAAAARREKLKQAYLKKKLEKIAFANVNDSN